MSAMKRSIFSGKEKQGKLAGSSQEEIMKEEEQAWSGRMKEGGCVSEELIKYLGEPSRADRQKEIMNMSTEDIERELMASGGSPSGKTTSLPRKESC
jgi:hypothetical protein